MTGLAAETPDDEFPAWTPEPLAVGAMSDAWCKEDFSVTYAMAVGTAIGVTCEQLKRDINGWDILYRGLDTDTVDGPQLAVQLKCTLNRLSRINEGQSLSFPLDVDGYNHLRKAPTHPPRLLVVVELREENQTRWVEPRRESIRLHASAWFVSLAGQGPLPPGQKTTSVHIPMTQRFDPAALSANMRSCP